MPDLRPGDWIGFWPDEGDGHSGGIYDTSGRRLKLIEHTPEADYADLMDIKAGYGSGLESVTITHFPDIVNGCRRPVYVHRFDSTFKTTCDVRHQWDCCWHENLAKTWPWYGDSSAYACLSWTQTNGTTWDTLISPRMNFAACSAAVLRQQTLSTLLHASNRTIAVRGSTDDGATWPHLIGSDSLTEASLPWATNQRNVRIAWIYKGPVQSGRYWCIDDVEIWAKPSRQCDMSVSEVRSPKGILTQGPTLTPAVFVWNHGRQTESIPVTMSIGQAYN
ncbi:hypothetical protein FJY71_06695, partial [candidate division WOR-3 bacterium]|nr:hypothetical protein [candidate division WOR-3 bacterium]